MTSSRGFLRKEKSFSCVRNVMYVYDLPLIAVSYENAAFQYINHYTPTMGKPLPKNSLEIFMLIPIISLTITLSGKVVYRNNQQGCWPTWFNRKLVQHTMSTKMMVYWTILFLLETRINAKSWSRFIYAWSEPGYHTGCRCCENATM